MRRTAKDSEFDLSLSSPEVKVVYAHDLFGNFTFLNHTGELILGYSCEEARRMNVADVIPPEIAAKVREQAVSTATKSIGTVYEIEMIAKDGHRVLLEVSTRLVLRQGERIEIQGLAVPSIVGRESPARMRSRSDEDSFFES